MNDEWNDVRKNMANYRLERGTMNKKCVVTNLISMEFFFPQKLFDPNTVALFLLEYSLAALWRKNFPE